jgi:hypothetical protein
MNSEDDSSKPYDAKSHDDGGGTAATRGLDDTAGVEFHTSYSALEYAC